MATNFCQRCKQEHPGRACDYDDAGECAETVDSESRQRRALKKSHDLLWEMSMQGCISPFYTKAVNQLIDELYAVLRLGK